MSKVVLSLIQPTELKSKRNISFCSQVKRKPPISLGSGHTVCKACLFSLQRSPFDQTPISPDLPVNTALLQLIGTGQVSSVLHQRLQIRSEKPPLVNQLI